LEEDDVHDGLNSGAHGFAADNGCDCADVHASTSCKATPLHIAAKNGHAKAIWALAFLGADVHARFIDGATPLHVAAKHGHVDAISALAALGADVRAAAATPRNDGATPLHLAAENAHAIKELTQPITATALQELFVRFHTALVHLLAQ
jgi:ankyrin repeat protein